MPGPEARLPEPALLAAMVNQRGTSNVAAGYRVTRSAVQKRLTRAGYKAGPGQHYPFYRQITPREEEPLVPQPFLTGSSPPRCPECGGEVQRVDLTISSLKAAGPGEYQARPAITETTYRCRSCRATVRVPSSTTVTERRHHG